MATHRRMMTAALSAAAALSLSAGSALAQPASQPGSAPSGTRSAGPRGADGVGGARSRTARVEARGARVRAGGPQSVGGDRGLRGTRSRAAQIEARSARVNGRGARVRQEVPRVQPGGPDSIGGNRGLGGVRSRAPRGIGRTGSLLPPVPERDRRTVQPTLPVITDDFGRILRRPGGVVRRPVDIDDFGDRFDERAFAAAAALRDEDFWLKIHLGGPGDFVQRGRRTLRPYPYDYLVPGPHVNHWPYGRRYNQWPVYTIGAGYVDPSVYYGPQYSYAPQYTVPPPAPTPPAAPPRELTPAERADLLLSLGAVDQAIEAYRTYLGETPDDALAMRSLAVALLRAGRPEEAVAVAAMAYETDPMGLALRPIEAAALFDSPEELRRELNRAVGYANNVNTASSWLLVAALMQAEGRERVAARMVERATELGLSERVAGALAAELES